jgi:hypothetical protein
MLRSALPLILGIALLVSGCAPASTQEPLATRPSRPGSEWNVKMAQSGGIMGLMRSVEVSSDGGYTVTDGRANKTATGKLDESGLSELREIVETSQFISGNPPGVCADCFIYEIEIRSGGNTFTAQVDDITLPGSGMEPLVEFLRGLMDSSLR